MQQLDDIETPPRGDAKGLSPGRFGLRGRGWPAPDDVPGLMAAVLDANPAPMMVVGRDGTVLEFNHACESISGYRRDEVRGCLLLDHPLIPEGRRPEVAKLLDSNAWEASAFPMRSTGVWCLRDGRTRTLSWTDTPVVSAGGVVEAIIRAGVEEAEARPAETVGCQGDEQLRMFAALVEDSSDFIALVDLNLRVTYLNSAGLALAGLGGPEAVASTIVDYLTDETRFLAKTTAIPTALASGHWAGEGRLRHARTGRPIDVRIDLRLLRGSGSEVPRGLAVVIRDVTEQARARDELRRAKDSAEAGRRAKSAFLANMSHELLTPLTGILGSAAMLHDASLPPEAREDALGTIHRNGDHLRHVINNILDLTKLETDHSAPELVPASPVSLLADVFSELNVRARAKGIDLVVSSEGRCPREIRTDPVRLRKIFHNLVSNAIKFTPGGTVEVDLGLEGRDDSHATWFRFEVRDRGIGMTPEQLSQIFNPFYQADASHTRLHGGTGLGLSIAGRLAESLGGEILVESAPGLGSLFTLRIPVVLPSSGDLLDSPGDGIALLGPGAGSADEPPQPLRGRVLLAEDSRDNQRVLTYYLERLGLSIEIAEDGRAAVELGTTRSYDLILMDIQMPELDGYGATRLLRERGFLGPIIALTAHVLAGDAELCLAAGCDDYLRKPVEPERLARALRRHLEGHSSRSASRPAPPAVSTPASMPATAPAEGPLRCAMADDAGFMELVRDYVPILPDYVLELRRNLEAGKLVELAKVAHTLRGSGGMYGYPDLTEVAGLIEDAAREGQDGSLIDDLIGEIARLVGRIGRGLDGPDGVSRG